MDERETKTCLACILKPTICQTNNEQVEKRTVDVCYKNVSIRWKRGQFIDGPAVGKSAGSQPMLIEPLGWYTRMYCHACQ